MPVDELSFVRSPQVVQKTRTALRHSRVLAVLAPAIVGIWIVLDLVGRFVAPSLLGLDPWLVVSRFPPRFAPFSPNQSFYLPVYVGGNARAANIEPTEFTGPIRFSTDHLGFRTNPYLGVKQRPDVLFFKGDSFTYGVGLSDEQTLASVMTAKYGIPSYNGGRFHDDPEGMPELDWLLTHLPGRPSTVVYTYLEHLPLVSPSEKGGLQGALLKKDPRLEGDLRYGKQINTFFWELSPARVVTTRFFNELSNDKIFPNESARTVESLPLPSGQKMLFHDYEYQLPQQDRGQIFVAQTARGFEWLQSEFQKRHLRLIVLLMPNRYTLYAPLLGNVDGPWAHYLDRLNVELKKLGIETVNGLEVYRSVVKQEVQTGNLSFFREDTHWNAHGVNTIAAPLAKALQSGASQSSSGRQPNVVQ